MPGARILAIEDNPLNAKLVRDALDAFGYDVTLSTTAEDGLELEGFPEGTLSPLRRQSLEELASARGFGVASGFFFPFDAPLDRAALPSPEEIEAGVARLALGAWRGGARHGALRLCR